MPCFPLSSSSELLRRAGGIPLFAEEYVRMQQDGGTADVPETLHGIVAARIDGLPSAEKALLQAAAVLGKVFWTDALAALAGIGSGPLDDMLFALERKEFVRRERRSTVAGARQLAFVHALVRDASYGQMPRAERTRLHRRAAEWIETLPPDRSEDRAEMLAHHYLAALEYARSAGIETEDLSVHAAAALREAGDRAFALNAFTAAVRSYAAALELDELDPRRLLAYARALFTTEFRGEDEYAKAAEAALTAGDVETAAEAEIFWGEAVWSHGDRDAAFTHFDRAAALVVDAQPSPSKAFVTSNVSRFNMLAGRSTEAIRVGGEALAMAEELGLDELRAHALNNIGVAKANSGDLSGLDDLRESIDITRALNSPESFRGLTNLASLACSLGDQRRGEELHREGLDVCERFGLAGETMWLRAELAVDAYFAGRWDEALEAADTLIEQSERGARHYMEHACRDVRSVVRLGRGDVTGAIDDVSRGLELAEGIKDPQALHPARAYAARVLLAVGRREDSSDQIDSLLVDVVAEGVHELAHSWTVDLAVAMEGLGREAEFLERAPALAAPTRWLEAAMLWADGEHTHAADLLDVIGALPLSAEARLRAATTLIGAGRRPEADEQLRQALAFFRSVGATRYIREGEALLAAAS